MNFPFDFSMKKRVDIDNNLDYDEARILSILFLISTFFILLSAPFISSQEISFSDNNLLNQIKENNIYNSIEIFSFYNENIFIENFLDKNFNFNQANVLVIYDI